MGTLMMSSVGVRGIWLAIDQNFRAMSEIFLKFCWGM